MTDIAADDSVPVAPTGPFRRTAVTVVVLAAVGLCAITVGLGAGRAATTDSAAFGAARVVEVLAHASFVALGGILLLRRPRHPIGCLFAVTGVGLLLEGAAREYAFASLPGWPVATWVAAWIFAPALTALIAVVLVFPTGHAATRLSRGLLRVVLGAGVVLTLGWAVASWPQRGDPRGLTLPTHGWPALLPPVAATLVACLVLATVALVMRYRRAQSEERLQLKWLAVAAFGLGLAALVGLLTELLGLEASGATELVGTLSIAGIPLAVTLAILRYRLYDIDRIISRTLAYTVLTGLLGAVYAAGVLLMSGPTLPFDVNSDVAVATSTLVVAALFDPLRRRLQTGVDRYFNRASYDARRVVDDFATRLGSALELDDVLLDLRRTVQATVPARHLTIWLRPSTTGSTHPIHTAQEGPAHAR